MKTKKYCFGRTTCQSYMKPQGKGFEVGFKFNGKPLFVGNFIHREEATRWWTKMDNEIHHFTTKFKMTTTVPKAWYQKFMTNHLYKTYYGYLDKLLPTHHHRFNKAWTKDTKRYRTMQKHFEAHHYVPFRRAS